MPRPNTLPDLLKGMQRQIDRIANPPGSAAAVLDVLAVADERFNVVDANALTIEAASSEYWGGNSLIAQPGAITDAVRIANLQGDGLQVRNLCPNGGFETGTGNWGFISAGALQRVPTGLYGTWALQTTINTTAGDVYTGFNCFEATASTWYTLSFWACATTAATLQVTINSGATAGALTTLSTQTAALAGDGVYRRFIFKFKTRASEAVIKTLIGLTASGTFCLDGVQLEQGQWPHDYLETSFGVLTYRAIGEGSTGIYVQSQQLVTNGGFESGLTTGWAAVAGGTISVNTSPPSNPFVRFGSHSLRVACAATGDGAKYALSGLVAGQTYTYSAWVFTASPETVTLSVESPTGTAVASTTVTTVDGVTWVRGQVSFTAGAGGTATIFATSASGAATLFVDGVQVEKQTFATPYIEYPIQATRLACQLDASSGSLSGTTGWMVGLVRLGTTGQTAPIGQWGDLAADRLGLLIQADGTVRMQRVVGGTSAVKDTLTISPVVGDVHLIAGKWSSTQLGVSLDGAAFALGASTLNSTPAGNVRIGGRVSAGDFLNGELFWWAAGNGTLADADVAALQLLVGQRPPTWNDFPSSASPTMIYANGVLLERGGDWGAFEWA